MVQSFVEDDSFLRQVAAAGAGDRAALESVVSSIEPMVRALALRFFGCPHHAQDAAQEALLAIVRGLPGFRGESRFTTWAYRVAANRFLSFARSAAERASPGFAEFDRDLADLPAAGDTAADVERSLLLEEVKIGCTLAMLLCLDRPSRLAYVLGEICELDHREAALILDVTPAAYRKRLQRACERIVGLMRRRCGLFDAANPCRCGKRIARAIERGYVDPERLVFATSAEQARRFPGVLAEIRKLEEVRRAAALYRSHPDPEVRGESSRSLLDMLGLPPQG